MKEIFEFAFSIENLIPTILLLFVSLYWLVVLIGLLDVGSLDIHTDVHTDFDLHPDVHADIHTDVHADVHGGEVVSDGPGGFMQSLIFFNVGKVPLLILLSFFAVPLWFLSMIVNYYLKIESFGPSLILLIPEVLVSLFVAKFLTAPIAYLFKNMDDNTGKPIDFTGRTAIVRYDVEEKKDGQIEIDNNGIHLVFQARSIGGRIVKGEQVIIIEYIKEENYYLVEPF